MEEKKTIAEKGNYQELRTAFFQFRVLVVQKKINYSRLSKVELDNLKFNIVPSTKWTEAQAIMLYNLLQSFKNDLTVNGINVSSVPYPVAQKEVKQPSVVVSNHISFNGTHFVIHFKYNPELVDKVKKIPDREFDKDKKYWKVPLSKAEEVQTFAERNNFRLGESAQRAIFGIKENLEQSYSAERIELGIPLKMEQFDYQTVGTDFAIRIKRALIADAPGLGKTCQAIAAMVGMDQFPIIVVCPKSLRHNWVNEWEMWTDKRALVATDKIMPRIQSYIENNLCHVLVMNYAQVKKYFCSHVSSKEDAGGKMRWTIELNKLPAIFKGVVWDEGHDIRNEKTELYKVNKKVTQHMENRILLTGTPIVNKVNDMASMLDLLGHLDEHFVSRWKFNTRYNAVSRKTFEKKDGKKQDGDELLAELNLKLRSVAMIRREKHQVLKELPDKIRTPHKIELSNRKEYDHAYLNLQDYLAASGATAEAISASTRAQIIVQMNVLRKLSALGKIEYFKEFAQQLFDNGEKIVLFVHHKEILRELKKHFPKMLEISGDTTDDTINENKKLFMSHPDYNLIGCTYGRGAVGHTLTAASNYVALEYAWTDAIQSQSEDRIHRIGQKNTAYCHYFNGADTIDQHMYNIILSKRHLSKVATGSSESIEESSFDLLKIMVNEAKNAKQTA